MDDRKLTILRAIVQDYVETREPVGSKALLERHDLGVSPATVRNDMASLEEEGLIHQPHTSAGRIPTDHGYRMFVDHLSRIKPLSGPEKRAIETLLDDSVDLDDLLARTVRLLAQLTRQVAVVQYPSLTQARVRHIELVQVAPRAVVLVLITDSGRVDQRTLELPGEIPGELVARLRTDLNEAAQGRRVTDLGTPLAALAERYSAEETGRIVPVLEAVAQLLAERREERIVLAGTANLARSTDFAASIEPLLETIEEQIVLIRLLSNLPVPPGEVAVRIGRETGHDSLATAAVVGAGYGGPRDGDTSHLAVLGPTRMDYMSSIASVRAVSRYITHFLE